MALSGGRPEAVGYTWRRVRLMEVCPMRRMIPFVFTTLAVVISIALLTAYRAGLLAKVADVDWRERLARHAPDDAPDVSDVPETE
jgi:hypothetical protein